MVTTSEYFLAVAHNPRFVEHLSLRCYFKNIIIDSHG